MAYNWYETLPGDSDIVSQHPANERAFRVTVKGAFGVEHDTAEGRHKFGVGNTAARDAISTWIDGAIWFSTQDARNRTQIRSGGAWINSVEFVAGTVIIFRQATAPLGYTQQVDVTDRMLRIVSSGLTSGGAWAISGMSTANLAHTHSVVGTTGAENQTHAHTVSGSTNSASGSSQGTTASGGASTSLVGHTHTLTFWSDTESAPHDHTLSITSAGMSANGTHTHTGDGTWRPLYTDVIAAAKN